MAQQHEVTQYGTLVVVYGDNSTRVDDLSEEVLTNALVRITGAETKRIYFVTGHGDVPMAVRAMKSGAHEFLNKPFNDQELLDSINRAIESDALRRQSRIEHNETMQRL